VSESISILFILRPQKPYDNRAESGIFFASNAAIEISRLETRFSLLLEHPPGNRDFVNQHLYLASSRIEKKKFKQQRCNDKQDLRRMESEKTKREQLENKLCNYFFS